MPRQTSPVPETWLLTGVPRGGTSLCCQLAGKLPNFLALSEPIEPERLGAAASAEAAIDGLEQFAAEARRRALGERRATSIHVDGEVGDHLATDGTEGAQRDILGERGDIAIKGPLGPDFTLLIKHNAPFAALLERLVPLYPCLAVIRNPVAVLASWQTVPFPIANGRVPAGEQFDARLRGRLADEPDVLKRQLIVLNWFFRQYDAHLPATRILRYEDIVSSGGRSLYRALGHPDAPAEPLRSRNDNAVYDRAGMDRLLAALLEAGGEWTRFYAETDCVAAAGAIRG